MNSFNRMAPEQSAVIHAPFSTHLFSAGGPSNLASPAPREFIGAGQASVLICAGEGEGAPSAQHLAAAARAAGHRVLDMVPIHDAASQMSALVAFDAVILRCSGHEPGLDTLLSHLDAAAEDGRIALIIITDLAGLDPVHALIRSHAALILCEPEPADIAAALLSLDERVSGDDFLHDIGKDTETDRFDRLSDQLFRLNSMIETLVQDKTPDDIYAGPWDYSRAAVKSPGRAYYADMEPVSNPARDVSGQQVRALLRARRLRDQLIAPELFADPAWDIMLDLLAARLENTRVSVSSLCIAAAVPPTTALRWIRQLTDRGMLVRQADPRDGRRIFIALSDSGSEAVIRWFRESRTHLQSALGMAD